MFSPIRNELQSANIDSPDIFNDLKTIGTEQALMN